MTDHPLYPLFEKAFWYLGGILLALSGIYLISEMIMHLWISQPVNFYEPEIAMDAYRLSEGLSIYPAFQTGPFGGLYAPFYQMISSLFFVIGLDHLQLLRAISIVSMLVSGWLIWKTTHPNQPIHWTAILPLLLVLIWHNDVVRFDMHGKPDAFAALWMIAGIYFMLDRQKLRSDIHSLVYAMVAFTLAFATKQTMLFVLPPLLLTLVIHQGWKRGIQAGLLFLTLNVMIWPLLWWLTGPEMWFYVFKQAGVFPYRWGNLFKSAFKVLTQPLVLTALGTLIWRLYRKTWTADLTLLSLLLLFAYPAGVITAIKSGGMANAHLATYWLAGFIIWKALPLSDWLDQWYKLGASALDRSARFGLATLSLLLFLQLGIRPYAWLKSFQYRLHGDQQYEQLADRLQQADGQVYCPWDNYLTLKAGKPLVWSQKWEMETGLHGIRSRTNYLDIMRSSSYVVDVRTGAKRNTDVDGFLRKQNFTHLKSFAIGQSLTYHLWKAPEPAKASTNH
jgi:hypothetical protein